MKERMEFKEFKKEVENRIREFLPESFATAEVTIQEVEKNNNLWLTGIVIKNAESAMCPTIYLEQFYEEYKNGKNMEEILSRIAQIRVEQKVTEKYDVSNITDFEKAKKNIIPRLVNAKMNASLLEERPHKIMEDLAVTYHVMLDNVPVDGTASVAVTNKLMNIWNTSVDELHSLAIKNLPEILPSTFKGMTEVMSEMIGKGEISDMEMSEEAMYVLSNFKNVNGASALLDKKIMEQVIDKVGEFFILPSSIHETLIVPIKNGIEARSLARMVNEVNSTEVRPEEVLSENVYTYSMEEGLKIA